MAYHNPGNDYDASHYGQEEYPSHSVYNAPSSPSMSASGSAYNTPQLGPSEGPDFPPNGGQPRFIGAALNNEPRNPGHNVRHSFASSQHTLQSGLEYNSSVYALNLDDNGANASYTSHGNDTREGFFAGERGSLPLAPVGRSQARYMEEKRATYDAPRSKSKRKVITLAIVVLALVLLGAVGGAVYYFLIKPKSKSGSSSSSSDKGQNPLDSGKGSNPKSAIVTGGDGSEVTLEDGSTFTFSNKFGGTWYWDENDPFNNGARPQSWSPALNETFRYGIDKIRGVNIGGWLNTEPFISPALFEPYLSNAQPAVDEWTLSQAMTADTANGGISQLETHYKTFITEKDFADIAAAGLNYVRIPLGYWAIETRNDEPFLAKTSWTYFLKAIKWARKYGLRINLDFHALPGSQNGWNHSGHLGDVGFLNGPMGYANAQRSLDYIRILAEFISQPQYSDVITMFGIMNEPRGSAMGTDVLSRFYLEAYNTVRSVTGTGQGKGAMISIHDGFNSLSTWANFLPNADRLALDTHPYLCFGGQSAAPMSSYAQTPCNTWGNNINTSMTAFGMTAAGEWSNAVTDCGLWLNGVNLGERYDGTYVPSPITAVGSCKPWTDWQNYTPQMKDDIKTFALASMDALQNWFFWTWKIGNSSVTGKVETPAWSYQLGLENGWMPTDPRDHVGACGGTSVWTGPLLPWQTGGAGAGNIPPSVTASYAWPPPSISNGGDVTLLPSYTPTGAIPTLPPPTFPSATPSPDAGNGWFDASDTAGVMVPIPGCQYLDPWISPNTPPPSPLCQ